MHYRQRSGWLKSTTRNLRLIYSWVTLFSVFLPMKVQLYFQKFCITEESKVCILITDTKTVWSEGQFHTIFLSFLHIADIGSIPDDTHP